MAVGDLTLTNYGEYQQSGATLKTMVDAINISTKSGALYLIPVANGQRIMVVKVEEAG